MYIAECDTGSFTWLSLGKTDEEARIAMKEGWLAHEDRHLESTGEMLDMCAAFDDCINVTRLSPGECARDYQVISW